MGGRRVRLARYPVALAVVATLTSVTSAAAEPLFEDEIAGTTVRVALEGVGDTEQLVASWRDSEGAHRQELGAPPTRVEAAQLEGRRLYVGYGDGVVELVWDGGFHTRIEWRYGRLQEWAAWNAEAGAFVPGSPVRALDAMTLVDLHEADGLGETMGLDDALMARHQAACRAAGSARCDEADFALERPAREVGSPALLVDRHEVSRAQYERCVTAGVCPAVDESSCLVFDGEDWAVGRELPEASRQPDTPRTCITRDEAVDYCEWVGGSLPWEEEWSVLSGGSERVYPWGDDFDPAAVNFLGSHDPPHLEPVTSRPQGTSAAGLLHLAGNAYEWTRDGACAYAVLEGDGICVFSGGEGVVRGGSFASDPGRVRPASRRFQDARTRVDTTGFRCVVQPPPRLYRSSRRASWEPPPPGPACQLVADRQRAALARLLEGGVNIESFSSELFHCLPATDGSWGLVASDTSPSRDYADDDYASALVVGFSVIFCPAGGISEDIGAAGDGCLERAGFSLEYIDGDWGTDYIAQTQAGDLTGDGRSDLLLRIGSADEGYDAVETHLLRNLESGLELLEFDSPWLHPDRIGSLVDVDVNGRADVTFIVDEIWLEGGYAGELAEAVWFVAVQQAPGAATRFSVDAPPARAYALDRCRDHLAEHDRHDERRYRLGADIICARLTGADPAPLLAADEVECVDYDLSDRDQWWEAPLRCKDLQVYREWLTRPLPFEAARPILEPSDLLGQPLPVAAATASDHVDGEYAGYDFGPANAVDGEMASSWQVDGGVDAWVQLDFAEDVASDHAVSAVAVANGFQHQDPELGDLFPLNSRIARARLVFSTGLEVPVHFEPEARGFQIVAVDLGGRSVDWVRLEVDAVHQGSRWDDLAVSEVRVLGRQ